MQSVITRLALATTLTLALGTLSCEDPDITPPEVSQAALTDYQAVGGTYEVAVTASDDQLLAKVELFVVGIDAPVAMSEVEPFTMSWDTTQVPGGLAEVFVRATDDAGNTTDTEPVTVIVLTLGIDAELTPTTATASCDNGTCLDIKHGWDNPGWVTTILAVMTWTLPEEDLPWDFQLNMGEGTCPHHGTPFENENNPSSSNTSPFVVTLEDPEGFPEGQLFAHIGIKNASELGDQTIEYTLNVYIFE